MKKYSRGFIFLIAGLAITSLSACSTCGSPYKKELTGDSRLREANISYKKANRWIKKGECATVAFKAQESYRSANSHLSDAIFKLEKLGQYNNIDVKDDVYYCEKAKREIDVKIGQAGR
ncbi:MAG: hypothetical protein P9M07_05610 [Candidatus Aceula meridiana]|nr:hypothetical protein [Candidatus Aceula meridiana]